MTKTLKQKGEDRKRLGEWVNKHLGTNIDWSPPCFTSKMLRNLKRQIEAQENPIKPFPDGREPVKKLRHV